MIHEKKEVELWKMNEEKPKQNEMHYQLTIGEVFFYEFLCSRVFWFFGDFENEMK